MHSEGVDRRAVLQTALGWGAALEFMRHLASGSALAAAGDAPAAASEQAGLGFTLDHVKDMASSLASAEFSKPAVDLPEPFDKLSYDQYRDIRFKPDQAIWRGAKLETEIQLFAMGWLYDMPVDIWIVEDGSPRQLTADHRFFTLGPLIGNGPETAPYGFSGFRIHGPINRADYFDEYAVFQGASYLRAVGRGENYGASARGLAINTARAGGEEFPFFRTFWIVKPKPDDPGTVVVFALLDSPSLTGAYRFAIQPGESTVMDIDAVLYPRKKLAHIGLAPLTSMYLHGPARGRPTSDFRPSVHDSDGLAMFNGSGERLWRPLNNHKTLQISAFLDKDPKGFGLTQRQRNFSAFEDLEAHYERRPTVWVEPRGGWGEGFIELIEIPVDVEIHDNIVAFWKPATALEAGRAHEFAYKLYWGETVPAAWSGAWVSATRVGVAKDPAQTLFVIDFQGPAIKDLRDLPVCELTNSAGATSNIVVQRNSETSGIRVSFELNPDGAELVELRCALKAGEQLISESWLYRWTAP